MTINEQLSNQLNYIERLLEQPTKLSPEEKKIKEGDSPLVKAIKAQWVKPDMVDKETQTDFLFLLTPEEKKALDDEIKKYQKIANDIFFENVGFKSELLRTKNALSIETKAKEDAVVHNQQLQQLYSSETTELKDNIVKLNQALDDYKKSDAQKEQEKVQLRQEIKTLSERLNQTLDDVSIADELRKSLAEKNNRLESLMRTKEQENNYIKEQNKKVRKELDDAINVIKVNEEINRKPEMKDAWTQTELTYHDIDRMEANEKKLLEFLKIDNPNNPIKDEDRKTDCLQKIEIVGRAIARIEEDMEHSRTQGKEMKTKLEELTKEISLGKITETELSKKVYDLELLVKRKESEYQKSLRIGEDKWKELKNEVDKNKDGLLKSEQEKAELKRVIDRLEASEQDIIKNLEFEKGEKERFELLHKGLKKDVKVYKNDLKKFIGDIVRYRGAMLFGENLGGRFDGSIQWITLMDLYRNSPVIGLNFTNFTNACAKASIKDLYLDLVREIIKGSTYPNWLIFDGQYGGSMYPPSSCNVNIDVSGSLTQNIILREPLMAIRPDRGLNIKIDFSGKNIMGGVGYKTVYDDQDDFVPINGNKLVKVRNQGLPGQNFNTDINLYSSHSSTTITMTA